VKAALPFPQSAAVFFLVRGRGAPLLPPPKKDVLRARPFFPLTAFFIGGGRV